MLHPVGTRSAGGFARDPKWRPLRSDEVPPPSPDSPSSPVCYMGAPDPADYVPYWLRMRGG